MKKTFVLSSPALHSLIALLLSVEALSGGPVPDDFRIVAEYEKGMEEWKSWKLIISRDGHVLQETFGLGDEKKSLRLSEREICGLAGCIRKCRFFELSKRLDSDVTDHPTLILTVTMDKKTHRVEIYAPQRIKDKRDVKSFLRLWRQVLRKVRSPNRGQTADLDDIYGQGRKRGRSSY
jgi:hypothetical protein